MSSIGTQIYKNIKKTIAEQGWAIMHIFPSETTPAFSYTIGLLEKGLPDIIILGVDGEVAHSLLHALYDKIGGDKAQDILFNGSVVEEVANMPLKLVEVDDKYISQYLIQAGVYYETYNIRVMQLLWPDPNGVFPDESGFDERYREAQPVLTTPQTHH